MLADYLPPSVGMDMATCSRLYPMTQRELNAAETNARTGAVSALAGLRLVGKLLMFCDASEIEAGDLETLGDLLITQAETAAVLLNIAAAAADGMPAKADAQGVPS